MKLSPHYRGFETTFPTGPKIRFLFAMLLNLIHAAPYRPALLYLDMILLTASPHTCAILLPEPRQRGYWQAVAEIPETMLRLSEELLRWWQIVGYLEQVRAIEIWAKTDAKRLCPGENFSAFRDALPACPIAIIPYITEAATELGEALERWSKIKFQWEGEETARGVNNGS